MKLSAMTNLHREFAGVIKSEDFCTEYPNPYRHNPLTLTETLNRKNTSHHGGYRTPQFINDIHFQKEKEKFS